MKIPSPYTPQNRATRNFYRIGGGQFHTLRLYLRDIKTSMQNQKASLRKNHNEELEKYPTQWQMIDEVYEGFYYNFDKRFHAILMNSTFITAFSIFETLFKKVCLLSASKHSKKAQLTFIMILLLDATGISQKTSTSTYPIRNKLIAGIHCCDIEN